MRRRLEAPAEKPLEEIEFLIFSLAGGTFGVDLTTVDRIIAPEARMGDARGTSINGLPVVDVAERLSSGSKAPERPKILLTKGCPAGFLISAPEDVAAVPLEDIFPLPPLIERARKTPALWGIARIGERLIPLLDLPALAKPEESQPPTGLPG